MRAILFTRNNYIFVLKINKFKNIKKIIIICITLFGLNFTQAQDNSKSTDVKFGLKGGLNIANNSFSGDEAPSSSSIANFHIGVFIEVKLNDKLSFQPELVYSAQGSKFDYVFFDGEDFYQTVNTFKLNYINVPLMLKYYPEKKFFLEAGPQIGFLTSAKLKTEVSGFGSQEQDVKELFKSIDFGLGVGLGYNFSEKVALNARYNFGLSNIAETESGDNTKIKNNVFSFSLSYKFE